MDNDKNKNDIRKRLEELKKEKRNRNPRNNKNPFFNSGNIFLVIILLAFSFIFSGNIQNYFQEKKEITYSQFIDKINNGDFKEVTEKDNEITSKIKEKDKEVIYSTRKITDRIGDDKQVLDAINKSKTILVVAKPSGASAFFYILLNILPIIISVAFFIFIF